MDLNCKRLRDYGGMKREMGHQVARHIFNTVTAAEIHAQQ